MESKKLNVQGFNYSYKIFRNEESLFSPLFFINGAFQTMKSWSQLVTLLQGQFTIIVADLPGWGNSDELPSDYDFQTLSLCVDEVLSNENIVKINLIATSFGTSIATTFAKMYSNKTDNLILCSPLLKINSKLAMYYPEMKQIIRSKSSSLLSDFLCKVGLINCKAGEKGNIELFDLLLPLFKRKISKLEDRQLEKFLQNTDRILKFGSKNLSYVSQISTLVITGIFDNFTTPKACIKIAESFENSSVHLISRSDHMFLFERPKTAVRLISDFLTLSSSSPKIAMHSQEIRA